MSPEMMLLDLTNLQLQEKLQELIDYEKENVEQNRHNYLLKQMIIEEMMLRSWAKILGKKEAV